jgi:hypothetical protein
MAIDHEARARRAWPHLVTRADTSLEPFTYGEIAEKIGLHHRSAAYFLGVIQEHCDQNRLPFLNALAVNKGTGLPGKGYTGSARSYKAHQTELAKVRRKKWPKKAPF